MKKLLLIMISSGLGMLALVPACNEVDVTEPAPGQTDYSVYFVERNENVYFKFTPETGKLDTLQIPFSASRMTSSHDGELLYLSRFDTTMIYYIAAGTLEPFDLARGRHIVVSPDGKYLALEGDSLTIVRVSDYSVIFQDTVKVTGGMFGVDNATYYGGSEQHANLYVLSLEPEPVVTIYNVSLAPDHTIPLPGEEQILALWGRGLLEVYDIPSDSSFLDSIYSYVGGGCSQNQTATTSDRRMIFFCNPYKRISNDPCIPPEPIRVFDSDQNNVVFEFPLQITYVADSGDTFTGAFVPEWLAVTPDNKSMVVITELYDYLVTIELSSLAFVRIQQLGAGGDYAGLTSPLVP